MISLRSRIARILLSGLIAAFATTPSISRANGFGFCHPHGFGFGLPVAGTSFATNVGTSSVLMPMGLTTPLVNANVGISSGASLPMSLAPAGLTTNVLTTRRACLSITPLRARSPLTGWRRPGWRRPGRERGPISSQNTMHSSSARTRQFPRGVASLPVALPLSSDRRAWVSYPVPSAAQPAGIDRAIPPNQDQRFELQGPGDQTVPRFPGGGSAPIPTSHRYPPRSVGPGCGWRSDARPSCRRWHDLPVNANGELRVRVTFDNAPPAPGPTPNLPLDQFGIPDPNARVHSAFLSRVRRGAAQICNLAGAATPVPAAPGAAPRGHRGGRAQAGRPGAAGAAGAGAARRPGRRGKSSPSSSSQFQQSSLVTVFLFRSAELLGGTASARSPCPP